MSTPESLKLVSHNIHRALHPITRKQVEEELYGFIRREKFDIVALQEVWRSAETEISYFETLAENFWEHQCYGTNALFPDGTQGNVIFSRYPIVASSNLDISVSNREKRGALKATIETPNGRLTVINTHFGLLGYERQMQLEKAIANDLLHEHCERTILAGDFNDWNLNIHQLILEQGMNDALGPQRQKPDKTFPSFLPLLRLDRIYCSKDIKSKKINIKKGRFLSDHLPLACRFSW